jgi:glutamate carboxypeptidase
MRHARSLLPLALTTSMALPLTTVAQPLTPDEQRLVAAVTAEAGTALALLERVVNINSGTMNFQGVRQVGDVFAAEFRALGFETQWIDGQPFGRAGHLVATRAGTGARFLLVGHLDTVFERDSPFQRFDRVSETEARGPGIIDMKGGDVIIISALKALRAIGALDRASFTVVMTGDEEDVGSPKSLARQHLRETAAASDIVLAFENGAGDPSQAVVARRGHTAWTLVVEAAPAHSSQVFQPGVGAGAIFEVARVLSGFYDRLSRQPPLTFNPGVIVGGTDVTFDRDQSRGTAFGKTNVIAEHATAYGDLRAATTEQLATAKAAMREVADASLPHARSSLDFDDGYPPMAAVPGNLRLLALYDQVSRDLGTGPVTPTDVRDAGAADVAFTAGLAPAALDGIGLMGRHSHTVNETADLRTLPAQARRAALLIHRLIEERAR